MYKFLLSIMLLLQTIVPVKVGGSELPADLISARWQTYNNALEKERAILEKERIQQAKINKNKKDLRLEKYKISNFLRKVDKGLNWNDYTRVISKLESSHRYEVTNQYGYLGKYQISHKYLNDFGFTGTEEEFLKDRLSQELVMAKYSYNNILFIKKYNLNRFIGDEINGIKVTLFGMMASAHLVGVKNLNDYLNSNGEIVAKDGNNTSIEKYLKAFS